MSAPNERLGGMQRLLDRYADSLPGPCQNTAPSSGTRAIAVVGSTGFVGPHLVASLLRSSTSTILCLNRRADGEQRTISALKEIDGKAATHCQRLRFLVLDIADPAVGLGDVQAQLPPSGVDELIFNAWDPRWDPPLRHFEPLLKGLRLAIDFCASSARRPRLTFVSSVCAVGNWAKLHPARPAIPEQAADDCAAALEHGYGESKNVAEQLLVRAHQRSGLAVAVVRAGQIGGPSRAELGGWPAQGWLSSLIKASRKNGAFPARVAPLDWIPVDALADAIAHIAHGERNGRTVAVFNLAHPKPVPWGLLAQTLRRRFGLRIDDVGLAQWLDQPDAHKSKLYGFLRSLGEGRESDMAFETAKAAGVLPGVVPLTEELLEAWLGGWPLGVEDVKARL